MEEKLITVLISLWKAGRFLEAKLENLQLLQGFSDCWIVLLNCQNHDNESNIYRRFLKYDNVLEIMYDNYIRLYPTWNDGIKATKSRYIMNSNVDDMLHPTYVRRCCGWLDSKQEYACVSSRVLITRKSNQPDYTTWKWSDKMPFRSYPHSSAGPCPVWRRSLHEKHGYFGDYRVIGDARMWERWYADGEQFGLIKEDLVLYYRHNQSLEVRHDSNGKSFRNLDLEEDEAKRKAAKS
jgi:hypothetical protein